MASKGGTLRPTRYAHTEGITDICYSENGKHIITCGSDGDVRLFEGLDDDDCKSHTISTMVYCVASFKEGNLLLGTDLNMVQSYTSDEGKPNGIITRFTSYPTHINVSKDKNLIAVASSDMNIKVHDTTSYKDILFKGHEAPVLSVAIDPKGDFLASSSCDGTVQVWNYRTQTKVRSFPLVPKSNNFVNSSTLCRLTFTPDGDYLIVPVEQELHAYSRSNWKVEFKLQDPSIASLISVTSISPCGRYVAGGCRDGRIVIWNLTSRSVIANDKPSIDRAVTGVAFHPAGKNEIAFVNLGGEMGTMENFLQAESSKDSGINTPVPTSVEDNRPSSANGYLPIDEDLDDDDESISLNKIKSQMGFADDEEGTFLGLPDAPPDAEMGSRPESRLSSVAPLVVQPTFPEPQKPFQPGMSPDHLTDRYMLWNNTGIVRQYRSEDENSIEVEFHNSQVHHPMHLNTPPGVAPFTLAALSDQALVLAAESQDDILSKMEIHHFSAWDGSKEWQTTFPEGEDVVAVSLGDGWIAVATDTRHLRLFSTAGVQLAVLAIPGPVVCLAGCKQQLLVTYHSGIGVLGQQCLSAVIINVRGRKHLQGTPCPIPLSPNSFLAWAGFTDEGSPILMDSAGIVRLFTGIAGSFWNVILNSKNYAKGKSDHYFLVGANELQGMVRCIFCKGSRYPPVIPKPHVTVLEFKIPLCEPEEEKSCLEENLIEAKLASQLAENLDPMSSEVVEINKKLKESMIKLFALACRSERESRALQVCESMSSPDLIELAIKYASKTHRMQLAERLSSVVESKVEEQTQQLQEELSEQSLLSVDDSSFQTQSNFSTEGNDGDTPTRSNPLLTAMKSRRSSNGRQSANTSLSDMNPFRKKTNSESSPSRGIAVLDSLKLTKNKEAPILRPVMKKPKSKQSVINLKKSVSSNPTPQSTPCNPSDVRSKENDESLANKPTEPISSTPKKKISALKLWFEDNKEMVTEKFPDAPDSLLMVKAASIFKDLEDSVKQKYKTMALEQNQQSSDPTKDEKKRASEVKGVGEPAEKKSKSGLSKLSAFTFTAKES